jgi:hypothetical protein
VSGWDKLAAQLNHAHRRADRVDMTLPSAATKTSLGEEIAAWVGLDLLRFAPAPAGKSAADRRGWLRNGNSPGDVMRRRVAAQKTRRAMPAKVPR